MPEEQIWQGFFDPEHILNSLGVNNLAGNIVEFGCGYGTFTVQAARRTKGIIYAIDIDEAMIQNTQKKANENGIKNISVIRRDFVNEGTGLPNNSCEFAMVFNILHAEKPIKILLEAKRNLQTGGKVGIIHWNYDPTTPRGPSMNIRPRPEQCQSWLIESGFIIEGEIITLPPYHYGMVGKK